MKRKILLLMMTLIGVGVLVYIIRYIPIFYLKQNYKSENINFTLYKNPWYYQTNIIVSTEPFMMTQITETSRWKWNIDIKGEISVFPKVYVQVINADTENIITKKIVSLYSAENEDISDVSVVQYKQHRDLITKVKDNYPYKELFPYVSSTMIADYTNEPKTILITRKTDTNVSLLMNELDIYLRKNLASLDLLKQNGVVLNFNKDINPQAVTIVE